MGEVPGFGAGKVTLTVTASSSPGAAEMNVISLRMRAKGELDSRSPDRTTVLGSALNVYSFVPVSYTHLTLPTICSV